MISMISRSPECTGLFFLASRFRHGDGGAIIDVNDAVRSGILFPGEPFACSMVLGLPGAALRCSQSGALEFKPYVLRISLIALEALIPRSSRQSPSD